MPLPRGGMGDLVEQGCQEGVGIEIVIHRNAMPSPQGRGGPVVAQLGPPRPAEPDVDGMGREEFGDVGVRLVWQERPDRGVQGCVAQAGLSRSSIRLTLGPRVTRRP